jgi:hypothetical protein
MRSIEVGFIGARDEWLGSAFGISKGHTLKPAREPPGPSLSSQFLARVAITTALIAACPWILRGFLGALIWAAVFAIALWPLYGRLLRWLPKWAGHEIAPLLLTVAIAFVFLTPVVLLERDSGRLNRKQGIPAGGDF